LKTYNSQYPEIELFQASSGYLSARAKNADKAVMHIHSTVKPEQEYSYFDDIDIWGEVLVFSGTGLGYHLLDILNTIPDDIPLVFIEFYPVLVENLKKIVENIPNSKFYITDASEDEEPALLSLRSFFQTKKCQIIHHPVSYKINKEFYDELIKFPSLAKNASAKKNKFMLFYGEHFLQNELKNNLTDNDVYAYCEFPYETFQSRIAYESEMLKLLSDNEPDALLSINMKGIDTDGIVSEYAEKLSIPIVIWFVDDPHQILISFEDQIRSNMIACCWERSFIPYLKTKGFSAVHYLPLAGDATVFSPAEKIDFSCDVSFVGSAMASGYQDMIRKKYLWTTELDPLIKECAEALLDNCSYSAADLIATVCDRKKYNLPFTDHRNMTWLAAHVTHCASMLKRKIYLGTLIDKGIHLYGDKAGWYELFDKAPKVHDDVPYGTTLSSIYQKSRVSINVTSCQMASACNQRVFDVPLSGGFLITDSQSALGDLFDLKNEVVFYSNTSELIEKVDFYLKNEAERKKISALAREKIIQEHTYKHRIKEIVKIL